MTDNTPGTNAMHPSGGAKPHRGKVVHSTDGKRLTEEDGQEGVLQNTEHGYEETSLEDVPLSDATGEGRLAKKDPEG